MSNIKTKFVKNIGRELYERYGDKFTSDFSENKEIVKSLIDIKSKKLRNTITGYITNLKNQEEN